jgi:hypothetical protein
MTFRGTIDRWDIGVSSLALMDRLTCTLTDSMSVIS